MIDQWLPIETAPKDGTWVLLSGGVLGEQWEGMSRAHPAVVACWTTAGPDERGKVEGWFVADFDNGYGSGIYYNEPTHWMLVPEPADIAQETKDG